MPEAEEGDDAEELDAALAAGAPEIYFNSAVSYLTDADIVCVLHRNGRPAAVVNMSAAVARVLADQLLELLDDHDVPGSQGGAVEP